MVDMSVDLSGIKLKNPVIPASGTFGYGLEFAKLFDLDILGAIAIKGTTSDARLGNPLPRIAESPCGMINSVGLENPGAEAVLDEKLPQLEKVFDGPIIANVSGSSPSDYAKCASVLSEDKRVAIIEVNISCPNVESGGMAFGQDPVQAAKVTKAVKEAVDIPVYVKLSPNTGDIAGIAAACQKAGADGLCLINTLSAMRIDIRKREPVLAQKRGGLSGPAIFPIALSMVNEVFENTEIPIIGMGGISSAEDLIEMIMAGATAVEIGAANLTDPWICKKIIDELPVLMEKLGINDMEEIRGII